MYSKVSVGRPTERGHTMRGSNIAEGLRNLSILRDIIERHQHAKIQVGGKSVAVDAVTAQALVTVHDALDLENQCRFAGMTAHDSTTFQSLIDFSWSQVKL